MALPTAPFDAAKSLFSGLSIIKITIGEDDFVFESRKLGHKDNREYKMIERPDAKGVLRVVRKVCVKGAEEFIYEADEAKRLVTDLFAGSLSGLIEGATVQIWNPDPSDATGKVSLSSEAFSADIVREGDWTAGDGDFTKPQIKISSRKAGDVTWTVDANVPA